LEQHRGTPTLDSAGTAGAGQSRPELQSGLRRVCPERSPCNPGQLLQEEGSSREDRQIILSDQRWDRRCCPAARDGVGAGPPRAVGWLHH
jgi:hypothetical protein